MDTYLVFKKTVSTVVGLGTGAIVSQLIKRNVDEESGLDKVSIPLASYAIAGLAADATRRYAEQTLDDLRETCDELVKSATKNK